MTYKLKVYVSEKSSFNLEKRLGWLEKNYNCKGVETGILTRHVAREKGQNQFTFYNNLSNRCTKSTNLFPVSVIPNKNPKIPPKINTPKITSRILSKNWL